MRHTFYESQIKLHFARVAQTLQRHMSLKKHVAPAYQTSPARGAFCLEGKL